VILLVRLEAARRERESLTIKAGTRARAVDAVSVSVPAAPGVSPANATPSPAVSPAGSHSMPANASNAPPAKTEAPATASAVDVTGKSGPQRGAGTTVAAAGTTDVPAQEPGPQILVAHGEAPYLHDKTNSDSYFVTTRDSSGTEKTVWGIDLPRALEESGAQIGDQVSLANLGKRWVTVNAPVKDAAGNVTGYEEREVHRNTWEVKVETLAVDVPKADPPVKTVGEFRKEVETAIAGLPENVRRVVMDRFAEHMAAGLEVQTEVATTHATPQAREAALGPALETRLDQVDRERVARETPPVAKPDSTREAPRHKAPKPKPSR
jgi:hypothetical protein